MDHAFDIKLVFFKSEGTSDWATLRFFAYIKCDKSLQCRSVLFFHFQGLLNECNCAQARYLFQQDKHYDTSYDTGDMSLQCGRKVDVVKVWMMWKGKGDLGMERDIDHIFSLSR